MRTKTNSHHTKAKPLKVPREKIADFCNRHHVARLSLFGSALRNDFRKDSDIDVLIEFESGQTPGFLGIARMERELAAIVGNPKIDLRTPEDLSHYFRADVLKSAQVQYERI